MKRVLFVFMLMLVLMLISISTGALAADCTKYMAQKKAEKAAEVIDQVSRNYALGMVVRGETQMTVADEGWDIIVYVSQTPPWASGWKVRVRNKTCTIESVEKDLNLE